MFFLKDGINDPLYLEDSFGNLTRVLPIFHEEKIQEQMGGTCHFQMQRVRISRYQCHQFRIYGIDFRCLLAMKLLEKRKGHQLTLGGRPHYTNNSQKKLQSPGDSDTSTNIMSIIVKRTSRLSILINHRVIAFQRNYSFCLSPHWFLTEGSPCQNPRTNPCFPLSGNDPQIADLEFSLAAHRS